MHHGRTISLSSSVPTGGIAGICDGYSAAIDLPRYRMGPSAVSLRHRKPAPPSHTIVVPVM